MRYRTFGWLFFGLFVLATDLRSQEPSSKERLQFFESKIRPVLVERCYACHAANADEIHGGLVLDSRNGAQRGGDTGPAVVPGKLHESLLIKAIRYTDKTLAMPPKEAGGKLPDSVIRDFEKWVADGASDPREGTAALPEKRDPNIVKSWWAFQPIKPTSPPTFDTNDRFATWVETDIDRFIAKKWTPTELRPMHDAEPGPFLRRLTFDLTGLPPKHEETEAFTQAWRTVHDKRPLIASALDRLLKSPAYGERWGRHWLDVARYAESSGKDVNVVYTHAWRYRDYVVDAFRRDKPFNQFVQEQIAGDQLLADSPEQRAEHLIATGFLAIGPKSLNETNPNQFAVDLADEQIDTLTQAFLGLTVSCARCHDHKFDPISQHEYTALAGIFLSTDTRYGTPGGVQGRNRSTLLELPNHRGMNIVAKEMSPTEWQDKQSRLDRLRQQQRTAIAQRAGGKKATDGMTNFDVVRIITQVSQLESELGLVNQGGSPKPMAMGVIDLPTTTPTTNTARRGPGPGGRQTPKQFVKIADSPFFLRGNIDDRGDPIARGIPTVFGSSRTSIGPNVSGRRELAAAIISPDNPLTSRVIVNRVWAWMFGSGLVESVDNFGTTGTPPVHAELLDYLAQRFVNTGWSVKQLVAEIAMSRVYRLESRLDDRNFEIDPDNRLHWRHAPRRLEAEEIRDSILSASGSLDRTPIIGSLIGRAGEGPIGGERMMALSEEQITTANHRSRSIYLPIARNAQPDILAAFDLPDASSTDGLRDWTNVPSQALFMLNSDFIEEQARILAKEILRVYPGRSTLDQADLRLKDIFHQILHRDPSTEELLHAKSFLERHRDDPVIAYQGLVRSLFATAEFRLLD